MTEKANPSINRPAEAYKTAGAIAYGGHGSGGFVVDGNNPTEISVQDGGITESELNSFTESSSGSSLDVTIDGGEAFVFGSWLAIDTGTTITLSGNTSGQTVYVGWNKNGADDVIVGLAADFSDASGDTDERIPLWTFDTDGSGVTSVTDERAIGYTQEGTTFTGDINLNGNDINFPIVGSFLDFQHDNDSGNDRDTFVVSKDGSFTWSLRHDYDNENLLLNSLGSGNLRINSPSVTVDGGSVEVDGVTSNARLDSTGNRLEFDRSSLAYIRFSAGGAGGQLQFQDSSSNAVMTLDDGGGMELNAGVLNLESSDYMTLPQVSSDPAANPGDMWYRTDLD